jgi:hypothetical protein
MIPMPQCGKCKSQIQPNARFCGNCGAVQTPASTRTSPATPSLQSNYCPPPQAPYPPPPPPPDINPNFQVPPPPQPAAQTTQTGGEPIVGVIMLRQPKSLGRYDSYAGVLTPQRLIFAQLTSEMLNAAALQAKEKAKAEGKGFFGQWAQQIKGASNYADRFLTMHPQAILAETLGNFELSNNIISQIKVHVKGDNENTNRQYFEIEIQSTAGKYKYHMDENSAYTDLLKRVFGDRVKMPFGYFSKTLNIKF